MSLETGVFWALGAVSDEQLRAGLATLLAGGARTEARIVAHLAEVIARKLYLRDGSASAFDYCQTRLELLIATRACSETPEEPLTRAASSPTLVPSPRAVVDPLSESRYRIQLNASVALKDKLELLRSLLSHSIASGDLAPVVERAVELALEHVQKQRFAKTERPRSSRTRMIKRSARLRAGAMGSAR